MAHPALRAARNISASKRQARKWGVRIGSLFFVGWAIIPTEFAVWAFAKQARLRQHMPLPGDEAAAAITDYELARRPKWIWAFVGVLRWYAQPARA